MDRGPFVDQSAGRATTLGDLITLYLREVTGKRPSEDSRIAEASRHRRFLREERKLCDYAATNLRPEHFEDYRERRLCQPVSRGRTPQIDRKTVASGTVRRELMLLKRVLDYRRRQLGLLINPVNTEDVKRPAVNDERDIRFSSAERRKLLEVYNQSGHTWLRSLAELDSETGARF